MLPGSPSLYKASAGKAIQSNTLYRNSKWAPQDPFWSPDSGNIWAAVRLAPAAGDQVVDLKAATRVTLFTSIT